MKLLGLFCAPRIDSTPWELWPHNHGGTWAMFPKIYHFQNLPPALSISQNRRTTGDVIETQIIILDLYAL